MGFPDSFLRTKHSHPKTCVLGDRVVSPTTKGHAESSCTVSHFLCESKYACTSGKKMAPVVTESEKERDMPNLSIIKKTAN